MSKEWVDCEYCEGEGGWLNQTTKEWEICPKCDGEEGRFIEVKETQNETKKTAS